MASSNKTPNYGLPQWGEDDTIEFTPEMTNAFSAIDAGIKANAANIGLLGYEWSDGTTLSVSEAVEKILPALPQHCIINAKWTNSATRWSMRISRAGAALLIEAQRDLKVFLFQRSGAGVWTEREI